MDRLNRTRGYHRWGDAPRCDAEVRGCFGKDGGGPPPAPAAPDPSVQVQAQARAIPSKYGPFGQVVYSGDPAVAGSFREDTELSPEQQKLYEAKTGIAQSLLDRTGGALTTLPTTFDFAGAADPNTNAYWTQQKKLLDTTWGQSEDRERQRLANQGIPEGSEAYTKALDEFQRQRGSSYEQAAANAITTGQDVALKSRQQRLNEIAQALGGQIIQPGGGGNPLDVAGAYANQQAALNRQYQGQLAGYNADVGSSNQQMGGLFSLGAAAISVF